MPNLSAIRKRIRTVASTQKITKAMKMVAAARFRRAQERVQQAAPYARTINELLENLSGNVPEGTHPLLGARPVEKRALVILGSDRGLCGAFNSGLFRQAEKDLASGVPTSLVLIGKKAVSHFSKRKYPIYRKVETFWSAFSHETAAALSGDLAAGYLAGEFDRVDVLYNEFVSVITQRPKTVPLIPIAPAGEPKTPTDYIYEPGREEIVRALVPKAVAVRFFVPCLNSQASEFGARMSAMDSATRNAGEMIDKLTLSMNRARQANITRELVEIISGAAAIQ